MSPRAGLKREIALALAIKVLLLYALWWGFFSHKPDRDTVAAQVAQQFEPVADPSLTLSSHSHQAKKESSHD